MTATQNSGDGQDKTADVSVKQSAEIIWTRGHQAMFEMIDSGLSNFRRMHFMSMDEYNDLMESIFKVTSSRATHIENCMGEVVKNPMKR